MPAVEPPPSRWDLDATATAGDDLVGVGADLEPGTILAAYRLGLFPMGVGVGGRAPLGWWSPDPRGVLPLDGLRVTRSMRQSARRYEVRVDTCFADVMRGCANPEREGTWINDDFIRAYTELHRLGVAHSVEAWDGDRLVGGLYGVSLGGLFAGESMFHDATDASKVALLRLVDELASVPGALLDVQWTTPHLVSLGAVDVPRDDYRREVARAIARETPAAFAPA